MKRYSLFLTLVLVLATVGQAQDNKSTLAAFGGDSPDERSSTRVLYFDRAARSVVAEFAINYGRPAWKKDYEDAAKFDGMTKGKVWRMGDNFWTTLDTNLPLKIAGKDIAPGSWYLGLHRSADGASWSLAFIDPAKARAAHLDPFEINKAPVDFKVPMVMDTVGDTKDKLTITLTYPKENFKDVTLRVMWGKLALKAAVVPSVPGQ